MEIKFLTADKLAMNYPPIPIKKMMPEWYKDLQDSFDKTTEDNAKVQIIKKIYTTKTIKTCVPVRDYMTSGYILRSHAQILITPEIAYDEKNFYVKSSIDNMIESHSHQQCPIKIDSLKHNYMKYSNRWKIIVPEGYSCLFYQPEFFFETRYRLFPGIVDCDNYDTVINFPGYILSNKSFYINPGDPIIAIFPFKRDEWTSNVKLVNNVEEIYVSKIGHYLYKGYKNLFHKKKSYK